LKLTRTLACIDSVGGDDETGDTARAASAQTLIWRFLQLFCEGHNHAMQLLCSWQPQAKRKIDMVKEACSLVNLIAKDEASLMKLVDHSELRVLSFVLDFLIEAVQGEWTVNRLVEEVSGLQVQ
jgi:hypothetical protein